MREPARVLVVEEDRTGREQLAAFFSQRGWQVYAVPRGEEALRTLHKTRPRLVTLHVVQAMDGLATLPELKRRLLPSVPVIVLLSGERWDMSEEAIRFGASSVIQRPFGVHELELELELDKAIRSLER